MKQIERIYKQAYESIYKQIEKIWLEMLEKGDITPQSIYQNNRLNNIMRQVEKELNKLGVQFNKNMQENLLDACSEMWESANKELSAATSILNKRIAKEIVNASYKNAKYSNRVWQNMALIRANIERCVIDSAITGRDIKRVSRDLAERMSVGVSDAKRIVVTETDRVMSETCRQNAKSRGYKTYHLLIESDACEECKKLEGKHFDISHSILPIHPYCKCCMEVDVSAKD